MRLNYEPTVRAAIALQSGKASTVKQILEPSAPYELGVPNSSFTYSLFPVYVRGQGELALHDGAGAAAEFQKMLDHPGVVLNQTIAALAHLQLGRAYALSGETTKAKTAYQDFFGLWKNADADIPILKEARAEYAKLQ